MPLVEIHEDLYIKLSEITLKGYMTKKDFVNQAVRDKLRKIEKMNSK